MKYKPSLDSAALKSIQDYESKPLLSKLRWNHIFGVIVLFAAGVNGLILALTTAKWLTILWAFFIALFSAFGITGGAHRLWAHRSYKAKFPLRLLAGICQTICFQESIYTWCWTHRVHHKFTETDADPHNAKRGFFFSHIGWLFIEPHPEIQYRREQLDMSDLLADPIVYYQHKFYIPLLLMLSVAMPTFIPWYFWNESITTAFFVVFSLRHTITVNITWLVNSVSHTVGTRPYDKFIGSTENFIVAMLTVGEGWHNYHHVFPKDYKAGELGFYGTNWTTAVIDFFAMIGWAYDRKTVSDDFIRLRVKRTGDGTHYSMAPNTDLKE